MALRKIKSVHPSYNYHLLIVFDDGKEFVFDVSPLLSKGIFTELKDMGVFNQVFIDSVSGCISWPNGADLDTQVLYYQDMLGQPVPLYEHSAS